MNFFVIWVAIIFLCENFVSKLFNFCGIYLGLICRSCSVFVIPLFREFISGFVVRESGSVHQMSSPTHTSVKWLWRLWMVIMLMYLTRVWRNIYTVKPVLRGHLWDKENMAL
jgi:hypothetical protein